MSVTASVIVGLLLITFATYFLCMSLVKRHKERLDTSDILQNMVHHSSITSLLQTAELGCSSLAGNPGRFEDPLYLENINSNIAAAKNIHSNQNAMLLSIFDIPRIKMIDIANVLDKTISSPETELFIRNSKQRINWSKPVDEKNTVIRKGLAETVYSVFIQNALKYSNSGITVSIHSTGDYHFVEIEDSGGGIPEEIKINIEKGVKRLAPGNRRHNDAGSGLGIYNAIRMLKRNNIGFSIDDIRMEGEVVGSKVILTFRSS